MARRRRDEPAPEGVEGLLNEREAQVLEALILEYIGAGEPVGSTRLARRAGLQLSPASIRNVMSRLEAAGYLAQPHTSAGRVPTDLAYRVFVDHLMETGPPSEAHVESIRGVLEANRGEVSEMLEQASRQLSHLTRQVGIVLAPKLSQLIVERLEFVRLDARRIVAVVVSRSGIVHHRVLAWEDVPGQKELERDAGFLNERFAGLPLPEMRERLARVIHEERAALDCRLARRFELGHRALDGESGEAVVFVEGAANLLDAPDFADRDDLRDVLQTLEEREILVGVLDRLIDGEGVQIAIGHEIPGSGLTRCSVVASSYGAAGRILGSVGIVGPTRMEYSRAVSLVGHLAMAISRRLSSEEH